nr:hypothetical protein [Tanacetum cinerariifolium]
RVEMMRANNTQYVELVSTHKEPSLAYTSFNSQPNDYRIINRVVPYRTAGGRAVAFVVVLQDDWDLWIYKPIRLTNIDLLTQNAIQKHGLHIHLVEDHVHMSSECNKDTNGLESCN